MGLRDVGFVPSHSAGFHSELPAGDASSNCGSEWVLISSLVRFPELHFPYWGCSGEAEAFAENKNKKPNKILKTVPQKQSFLKAFPWCWNRFCWNCVQYFATTRSPCSTLKVSWRKSQLFSSRDALLQRGWRMCCFVLFLRETEHVISLFTQGEYGWYFFIFFFSFCLRFSCCNVLLKKEVLKKMPSVLFFPIIIKSQCILRESAARKWHKACESWTYQCIFYHDHLARSFLV